MKRTPDAMSEETIEAIELAEARNALVADPAPKPAGLTNG